MTPRAPWSPLVLAAVLAGVAPTGATEIHGGRNPATDCYARLDVDGLVGDASSRTVECGDGDAGCDADGAVDGVCHFRVRLCLNRTDDQPTCVPPAALKRVKPRGVLKRLGLEVPPLDGSACGAAVKELPVPLRKRGEKPGKMKLRTVARGIGRRAVDRDVVTLVCKPRSCGDGRVGTGEQCDPGASPTGCAAGTVCAAATCTCLEQPAPCCEPVRIVTSTARGVLGVSTLPAFPFPEGVRTTIDVGPGDRECRHDAAIPRGGFTVPVFCIPALGFTSAVIPLGCAAGEGDGSGTIWDDKAPCPDADVDRSADTSDGVCNPVGQPCTTAPGGAGANTLGQINTTRGNGVCDASGVVSARLDIPVRSITWTDNDGEYADDVDCPDEDGVLDAANGTCLPTGRCDTNPNQPCTTDEHCAADVLISEFTFVLSPTTATARAQFVDMNGDGCKRAGNGPDSTRRCSARPSLPCAGATGCNPSGNGLNACRDGVCVNDGRLRCSVETDCDLGGTCEPGALEGSPAAGPCCVTGQDMTLVATGVGLSNGGPLYDLVFANVSPTTVTGCDPVQPLGSCTLTADACND